MPPVSRNRAKCSIIWDHFQISDRHAKKAECNYCKRHLSYKSTITNLKLHLKQKHIGVYRQLCVQEDAVMSGSRADVTVEFTDLLHQSTQNIVQGPTSATIIWRWFRRKGRTLGQCKLCHDKLTFEADHQLEDHLKAAHRKHYNEFLKLKKSIHGEDISTNEDPFEEEIFEDHLVEPCNCDADLGGTLMHKEGCPAIVEPCTWDYYDKVELSTAECRICKKCIIWKNGVHQLNKHLFEGHPGIPLEDKEIVEPVDEIEKVSLEQNFVYEEDVDSNDAVIENEGMFRRRSRRRNSSGSVSKNNVSGNCNGAGFDNVGVDEWNSTVDNWANYAGSIMKMLPRDVSARFQVQIIDRLMKEKFKHV